MQLISQNPAQHLRIGEDPPQISSHFAMSGEGYAVDWKSGNLAAGIWPKDSHLIHVDMLLILTSGWVARLDHQSVTFRCKTSKVYSGFSSPINVKRLHERCRSALPLFIECRGHKLAKSSWPHRPLFPELIQVVLEPKELKPAAATRSRCHAI